MNPKHLTEQPGRIIFRLAAVLLTVFTAGLLFSCSTAERGRLQHSRKVARAFETYHVFPDHRYYYLNQENNPYAVVAIQKAYRLTGPQWREFDPNSDKLKKLVGLVKDFPEGYAYGSLLLDPQGNRIGYWYSSIRIVSVRVDAEAQRVSIMTETPWLRDDDRPFRPGIGIGIGF